jgi:hypothetical protein
MKTNLACRAFASRSNHLPNDAVLTPHREPNSDLRFTIYEHRVARGFDGRKFALENSAGQTEEFAALKERVTASLEEEFAATIGRRFIRQVVNEAAALASTTSFPTLLLPALAEEKARKASQWATRQQAIRHQAFTLAA